MNKIFIVLWHAITLPMLASLTPAWGGDGGDHNLTVLVLPFENLSSAKSMVNYEVSTSEDPNRPKRTFHVDRYSEAPRAILEDILTGIEGVKVLERQRVDSMLMETQFGHMSPLVDPEKAVRMGKMLGANTIVMGSILDIREGRRKFSGYGIRTEGVEVKGTVRVRLMDIESGQVVLSRILKGRGSYMSSQYGGSSDSDVAYAVIESALEQLPADESFMEALRNLRPAVKATPVANTTPSVAISAPPTLPPASTAQLSVEVEFAPKPDNCDIEIDGRYVGGSPLKRTLEAGRPVKVRILKAGYQAWEREIIPEGGLRIVPELATHARESKGEGT